MIPGTHLSRFCLLAVLLFAASITYGQDVPPAITPSQIHADARARLQQQFDTWLKEPIPYRSLAIRECDMFPEGRIYPFVIPALAYANLAIAGQIDKDHAIEKMRLLLDMAIPFTAAYVHAPDENLIKLKTYEKQGTFLGTLNYALGAYRFVSDDDRYTALHDHLSHLLIDAFTAADGKPIASYPTYTWYFDSIMALASLDLWDRVNATHLVDSLIDKHMTWRKEHGSNPVTHLPRSYDHGDSRGCAISMEICLLANINPTLVDPLYRNYVKTHWLDIGMMAGFREWPANSVESPTADIDSGPVLLNLGLTATGIGIGSTIAVNDTMRFNRLMLELHAVSQMIQTMDKNPNSNPILSWFGDAIPFNRDYYTGFMYGDASLFYAVTWTKYPARPIRDKP